MRQSTRPKPRSSWPVSSSRPCAVTTDAAMMLLALALLALVRALWAIGWEPGEA